MSADRDLRLRPGALDQVPGVVRFGTARRFEDDLRIWEQKIYVDPPMLCDGDGPIGKLRRWYRQFYAAPSVIRAEEAVR